LAGADPITLAAAHTSAAPQTGRRHRVVIVGGGFGGLNAARSLGKAPVDVTLIDRRNFHLFQPLLYQVATGGLSPANIAAPLRGILARQKNCRVLLAEVRDFDVERREVVLDDGRVPYDTLIVAAGAGHSYFGHDEWAPYAPGLKTIEDATEIRSRILSAFEAAERETVFTRRQEWLTFVVVGAGPTGLELAGALAEIAARSLKHDFRTIDPEDAKILLVEAGPRVLSAFPPDLSQKATAALQRLGVEVRTETMVTAVGPEGVTIRSNGLSDVLPARTVLWAAGVQGSPLGQALASAIGAPVDRSGRITVQPDFSLPGHPEVFVIGDLARYAVNGQALPGVAPVAIQAGRYVARLISDRRQGRSTPAFVYRDRGSLATIGRSKAVADFGRLRFGGFIAWVLWLFVHLLLLVGFRNRLLVLVQWGWSYLSYDRSARLITERSQLTPEAQPGPTTVRKAPEPPQA
jgi:NADH dehydrogenase